MSLCCIDFKLRTYCKACVQYVWGLGAAPVPAILLGIGFVGGMPSAEVHADNLRAAMASAYKNYPELDAERARLRATDEGVQRARAGWKPRINGEAELSSTRTRGQPSSGNSDTREGAFGVQLTQPIFTGFRTHHAVNEAEADVRAGREQLRELEGQVLFDVAQAYLDVVRDSELLGLSEKVVAIYSRELRNARTRLRIGEVTKTDVHQAQGRRAEGLVALEQAKGDLARSTAAYRRLIGRMPVRLNRKAVTIGKRPKSLSAAINEARKRNPRVVRALYREQSARFAVSKEWGELMPRLDLEAAFNRSYERGGDTSRTDTAEVVGRLQVPIYQGGAVRARVRQVKHVHVSRLQEVEQERRRAVNDVRTSWANLRTAARRIKADRARVGFEMAALRGVRAEERVGQRTLFDVLNAEEDVFQAQVILTRDLRDWRLAHYEVLRASGRLNAQFLSIADVQYAPEEHYHDAKGKWLTTSIANQTVVSKVGSWSQGTSVTSSKWATTSRRANY